MDNQELIQLLNKTLKTDATTGSDSRLRNEYWPTGVLPMDALLGGGFQKGRMALLAGESATLKSMIGLATAGQVIKAGGTAALFDHEKAYNQEWAESLGVDTDKLILARPKTGEESIDSIEVLLRSDIDYICVDSIATLLPESEREFMMSSGKSPQPARIASLMSLGLRKLNGANEKSTIVWISQKRDNIGAMAFSPKSVITGGKAIHYYVSQSVALSKVGKLTVDRTYYNGDKNATDRQIVVQQFKAELSKARNTQPFQVQHFNFDLEAGKIDDIQYLIQQGLEMGVISKPNKMTWEINIVDEETGEVKREEKASGQANFKQMLNESPDIVNDLKEAVAKRYHLDPVIY